MSREGHEESQGIAEDHKSNHLSTEVKGKAEEMLSFVKKNVRVTGGSFGGILLGVAP